MEKEKIDKYMRKSINEAKKAYRDNEIPVGAIIVFNNKILSKSYNKRDSKNVVTEHAEISAIVKANKKLKNWRLNGAILFTTLEPCRMCKEVIEEAKIEKIYYAAKSTSNDLECDRRSSKYEQITNREIVDEASNLIKDKFIYLRNNEKK